MKPIHIITVGGFGEEVAARFLQRDPSILVTKLETTNYTLQIHQFPSARLHIFVCDKPLSSFAKLLDNIFYNWKEPWLLMTQEHPYLRIGPFIIPGKKSCYHCFEARYLQHSTKPSHIKALYDYYSLHPFASPKGFLPGFAGIVTSYTWNIIKRFDQQDYSMAGDVYQIHMLKRTSFCAKVLNVHGCARCTPDRNWKTSSVDMLAKHITPLLKSRSSKEVTFE